MFRRIQLKAKPIQTVFRRNFFDAEVKVPKHIEYAKDINSPSASLGNGIKGQKIFPPGTLMKVVPREVSKAIQALLAVTGLMVFWPKATIALSHFVHSVPADHTAAVKLTGAGESMVYIPQTYARLDKPAEDDE